MKGHYLGQLPKVFEWSTAIGETAQALHLKVALNTEEYLLGNTKDILVIVENGLAIEIGEALAQRGREGRSAAASERAG